MPQPYRVIRTEPAREEYRALSPLPRREVKAALCALRLYGTSAPDTAPLEDVPNTWRVRVNRLRIVFELDEAKRIIRVTRIRPRPTAYEGIERPPRSDQSPR